MDDEEMSEGTGDSVMDALEQLKGKMLTYMISKGETPGAEGGEPPPPDAAPPPDAPPEDEGGLEIEIDTAPEKPSVFSRVEGGSFGTPPTKKPQPKPRKRKPTSF